MGGGAGIALASDLVFASEKAVFGFPFAKLGLSPDSGTSFFLTRQVGLKKALEILFSGEGIKAKEALELGLINRIVPGEELEEVARSNALRLASGPTRALADTKRMAKKCLRISLDDALENEEAAQLKLYYSEDFLEGKKSFLEKRKPDFKGK
jgi:2-(1,2-epoxy-1,2-dihydrophenyl)acetyl-CoA isomerase